MKAGLLFCLAGSLAFAGLFLPADDVIIGGGVTTIPVHEARNYQQYVYLVVGSYWYPALDHVFGSLKTGKVRIRFTITSDGNLESAEVFEGKEFKELAELSLAAVKAPAPFRPFPPEFAKKVGKKYTDEYTFTFDGRMGAASANAALPISSPP
jgi:TonB family protein